MSKLALTLKIKQTGLYGRFYSPVGEGSLAMFKFKKMVGVFLAVLAVIAQVIPAMADLMPLSGEVSVNLFADNLTSQGWKVPGPMLETNIFIGSGSGFSFDVWNREGFKESFSDEIDFTFAYDQTWKGLEIGASVSYWNLRDFMGTEGPSQDFWNLCLSVGKRFEPTEKQEVFIYTNLNYVIPAQEGDGGAYAEMGVNYSLEMLEDLSLAVNPYFTLDSGLYEGEAAVIMGLNLGMIYRLSPNMLILLPGVRFTSPWGWETLSDGREPTVVWHLLGMSYSF